jgi:hypothetical protein
MPPKKAAFAAVFGIVSTPFRTPALLPLTSPHHGTAKPVFQSSAAVMLFLQRQFNESTPPFSRSATFQVPRI